MPTFTGTDQADTIVPGFISAGVTAGRDRSESRSSST